VHSAVLTAGSNAEKLNSIYFNNKLFFAILKVNLKATWQHGGAQAIMVKAV
jgi:hypothetical protein